MNSNDSIQRSGLPIPGCKAVGLTTYDARDRAKDTDHGAEERFHLAMARQ
jgi:hypothetical protein